MSSTELVATFFFTRDIQLSIPSALVMSILERLAQFGAGFTESVIALHTLPRVSRGRRHVLQVGMTSVAH